MANPFDKPASNPFDTPVAAVNPFENTTTAETQGPVDVIQAGVDIGLPPSVAAVPAAAVGLGETLISMGTGFLMMPIAGWQGIYDLTTGESLETATENILEIEQAGTYVPRTATGRFVANVVGETVGGGIESAGKFVGSKAPEGFELEAEVATKVAIEATLALAPFLPHFLRKGKIRKAQEKAFVEAQAQEVFNKKFSGPKGPSLKERVYRASEGKEPIKESPVSANPAVAEGLVPEVVVAGGSAVALPTKSWLGEIVDSPYLRLKQQFPDSDMALQFRKMESDRAVKMSEYDVIADDFLAAESALKRGGTFDEYKSAWLEQDKARAISITEQVVGESKAKKMWDTYTAAMEERFGGLADAGLDVIKVENYLPRLVTNFAKFEKVIPGKYKRKWQKVKTAYDKGEITETQFQNRLNALITSGAEPSIRTPTTRHAKIRMSPKARKDMHDAYASPAQAVNNYFNETGSAIVERNFLGKGRTAEDAISRKVVEEVEAGKMTFEQGEQLRNVLSARFGGAAHKAPHRFNALAKNVGYISTIGQIPSAIVQLGDALAALGRFGVIATAPSLIKAALPKTLRIRGKVVEPMDVGYGEIMHEMVGTPSKSLKLLDKALRLSGFKMIDRFGKRVVLTAAKNKLATWSKTKKGQKRLAKMGYKQMYDRVGKGGWEKFLKDLQTKDINNPNVRFAVINELAEIQPIFMSDMPIKYLKSPNGRIFYTLKTWAIRQLNRMREDIMVGDYSGAAKYAMAVYLGTNSLSLAKHSMHTAFHGEDIDPEHVTGKAIDAALQMAFISRYDLKTVRDASTWDIITDKLEPAAADVVDALVYDIYHWGQEDKQSRLLTKIPIVGRLVSAAANNPEDK